MILDEIIKKKSETLAQDVKDIIPTKRGEFAQMMKREGLYIIGEIKRASPSVGDIVADFHPLEIAQAYEDAGIDAISILTERHFFKGSIQYVKDVAKITKLPLLRKDFIIDVREILQAKQAGASLILLIVAILDDKTLQEFYQVAYAIGLECIIEVHNEEELQRALRISPQIIGINNRDLHTFQVDITMSGKLRPSIPDDIVVISESGIHTSDDIAYLNEIGVDGVLIGESFMRCDNIALHLKDLLHHE